MYDDLEDILTEEFEIDFETVVTLLGGIPFLEKSGEDFMFIHLENDEEVEADVQ